MQDYSALGDMYESISEQRRLYNSAVDKQFFKVAQSVGRRWLDIGTGDGKRALRLNRALSKELTVVEPSSLLDDTFEAKNPDVKVIRASFESVGGSGRFDVISGLWNVVGHVESLEGFFHKAWHLLDEGGLLFFDANSPFNVRRFGARAALRNLLSRQTSFSFNWSSLAVSPVIFYRTSAIVAHLEATGFSTSILYLDYENGNPVSSGFLGSVVVTARKSPARNSPE